MPLSIVTTVRHLRRIRRIVTHMRATRLLAGIGADHRRLGHFDQVVEFQCFDTSRVPDLGLVLDLGFRDLLFDFQNLLHAFFQLVLETEHAAVILHRALHGQAGVVDTGTVGLVLQARQTRQRLVSKTGRQWLVFLGHRSHVLDHRIAGGFAEYQQIEQELVPRRLAPCTEAQAHSPAA